MSIEVISAGLTLIEDQGRNGFEHYGVSSSGAFDLFSYELGCRLIDQLGACAFEILSGPFSVRTDEPLLLAVTGEAKLTIDLQPAPSHTALILNAGQLLTITNVNSSPVYLVPAGLKAEPTLGSSSYDTLSGLGQPPVKTGQVFEVSVANLVDPRVGGFATLKRLRSSDTIRYLPGPHPINLEGRWEVESVARTGIRIADEIMQLPNSKNLESFPVFKGAIQITPAGKPIILGPDSGTTGGYPVAGTVIAADLSLLAHLHDSQKFRFQEVDLNQAIKAKQEQDEILASAVIRPSKLGFW